MRREVDGLEMPAVLIGHDAGGLAALALAGHPKVCASVAVAPLLEGAGPLLGASDRFRAWLGRGEILPPGPEAAYQRVAPRGESAGSLEGLLVPEPAARPGSLSGSAKRPGSSSRPCLLVGQKQDEVVSPSLVEIVASGIEADFLELPGGHWPMLEPQLDGWMSAVHRWLVRRMGPELLLLDVREDLLEE